MSIKIGQKAVYIDPSGNKHLVKGIEFNIPPKESIFNNRKRCEICFFSNDTCHIPMILNFTGPCRTYNVGGQKEKYWYFKLLKSKLCKEE